MPPIDVSLSRIGVQSSVERGPVPSSSADRQRDDILFECPSKFLTIYARRHCAILVFSMVSSMYYYRGILLRMVHVAFIIVQNLKIPSIMSLRQKKSRHFKVLVMIRYGITE